MKKILFLFLFLTMVFMTNAGVRYTKQDSIIYAKYISQFKVDSKLPIGELIAKTALFFRETPYVASTLDNNQSEQLIVNLHQFDCTTFVESCVALSRTLKSGNYSFSNFCSQLKSIRYRDGKIDDYTSRLHYMTDWIYDNTKKSILTDETLTLGGIPNHKTINFMSTHTGAYKPLLTNMKLQRKIVLIEQQINNRHGYCVLNKHNINKISSQINDGDIIAFATNINGLDYTHISIAYHYNNKLTFIHASSKSMKVITEPQPLFDYCRKSTKSEGISIFRAVDL